jgi:hypothetical protein
LLRGPPIEREGDLEEEEIFKELMQCPEHSNAYIKTYARKKVQASTKEESNITNH